MRNGIEDSLTKFENFRIVQVQAMDFFGMPAGYFPSGFFRRLFNVDRQNHFTEAYSRFPGLWKY
jgi:hypothetical protein